MNHHLNKSEIERFLLFSIGTEDFAIPLLKVREVIAFTAVTPIPNMPSHFKGVINLRGQVISIIDLRSKIGVRNTSADQETTIIILDSGEKNLGVIVGSIRSVLSLSLSEISPPPEVTQVSQQFVSGIAKAGDSLILLLSVPKITGSEKNVEFHSLEQRVS